MKKNKTWDEIHSYLLKQARPYSLLYKLIYENGILTVKKSSERNLFRYMCRTIAGQQLSTKVAETLWRRIEKLCMIQNKQLEEICDGRHFELIKQCGYSKNKILAMQRLSTSFQNKEISVHRLIKLEEKKIKEIICSLWGFGPWSAEMILLGYFGRLDIWSPNDSALVRGIGIALGKQKEAEKEIIEKFSPYRTLLSRHIWKGLDEGRLK